MKKKKRPMTASEFTDLCDCVSKTGNSSHCMRLMNRPSSDLYYYLKKFPEERDRLTIARSFFYDEIAAAIHDLAFGGIPKIRRSEKGAIVTDDRGIPVIDRIPDPRLMTSLLKEHSSRLARDEKNTSQETSKKSQEEKLLTLRDEILSDPPPNIKVKKSE